MTAAIWQIGSPTDPRVFTLAEAEALLPLVRRITQVAYQELEPVRRLLSTLSPGSAAFYEAEEGYEGIVKRWVAKMERLGLVVKGLWLVNFDTGDGYLCWRFPELRLAYYHNYSEDFATRRPLREVIEELDPDWAC
ncbi:DUF2203 family protein [Acidiferrobacter sp.]|uniref:DUF2203 family protein n=1 Tax=Acidiferrobacter sp. TaxID=1872107 RepID=UPI0026314FB2|nr:DUF2203 family protein [Acidiferrobacter sp.]